MRMTVLSVTSNKTTMLSIAHWTDICLSQVLAIYFAGESMFIGGR
jgi:hypothetical protein